MHHHALPCEGCQIRCLGAMSGPVGAGGRLRLRLRYGLRLARKSWRYLRNALAEIAPARQLDAPVRRSGGLQTGDIVRVRSRPEVQATLSRRNKLKGCGFMEEMWPYCGTLQRVRTPVRRFVDERDYQVKRGRGIVLLEGAICEGTRDFGRCDRACYYFWREEWLEKIDT